MNDKDRLVQNLKQVNGIVCEEFSRYTGYIAHLNVLDRKIHIVESDPGRQWYQLYMKTFSCEYCIKCSTLTWNKHKMKITVQGR
jgi:hypothetical protein